MQIRKIFINIPVIIALIVLFMRCGGQAYYPYHINGAGNYNTNSGTSSTSTSTSTTGGSSGSGSSSSSSGSSSSSSGSGDSGSGCGGGHQAPYGAKMSLAGTRVAYPTLPPPGSPKIPFSQPISTTSCLKIDVAVDTNGSDNTDGSSFYSQCVGINIDIGYHDKDNPDTFTPIGKHKTVYVSTDGSTNCYAYQSGFNNAITSVDFSDYLNQGSGDPIDIQVSEPHSNTCGTWYFTKDPGCFTYFTKLQSNYTITGKITVHTDSTR